MSGLRAYVLAVGLVAAGLHLFAPMTSSPPSQVRSPRDSGIVIHHVVPPPSPLAPPVAPSLPSFARRPALPSPLGVDPGYRPLWVPETRTWNGFTATRVPGHWLWAPPYWPVSER